MSSCASPAVSWKASLHGGHSSAYCDHAASTLEAMLDEAVACGYRVFGVTEHAPRVETNYLYEEEVGMGWDVATLDRLFKDYAAALDRLIPAYAGRLSLLKGFEAEVVPVDRYPEIMNAYKSELHFDYVVGSVHHVGGIIIDYKPCFLLQAVEACGGLEALGICYYRELAAMVEHLAPEVVGHFDVIRLAFPDDVHAESPKIKAAALDALAIIRDRDAILDINTSGYRKGIGRPFPAPVYVEAAHDMGIPVCFGDDSHAAAQVGDGIEAARRYLLEHGIEKITCLERGEHGLNRRESSLTMPEGA